MFPRFAHQAPPPAEESAFWAGRANHGDAARAPVEFRADGEAVDLRAVQAPHEKPTAFRAIDECRLAGPVPGRVDGR